MQVHELNVETYVGRVVLESTPELPQGHPFSRKDTYAQRVLFYLKDPEGPGVGQFPIASSAPC